MPALQIYDKLLQFPLFQGMSRDDLEFRIHEGVSGQDDCKSW